MKDNTPSYPSATSVQWRNGSPIVPSYSMNPPLEKPAEKMDVGQELGELLRLRRMPKYIQRNYNYWLWRQAMDGRYRWPGNWPSHKPKLVHNMVKRIALSFTSLLMGKVFEIEVPPLDNGLEARAQAQTVEKIILKHIDKSGGWGIFNAGAQDGSLLGNTVFKTYIDPKTKWATVSHCQPDYFYGIPSTTNYMGDFAKVFYYHYIDKLTAQQMFPNKGPFRNEYELNQTFTWNDPLRQSSIYSDPNLNMRQVPWIEVWTQDHYLLLVGGQEIYNGKNPYGFIPFVSIPNIRITGQVEGKSDVSDVLAVNEQLNQMVSERSYIVRRWLNPTVVWEGAPVNYAEILSKIVGGGGAIPARLGAKLYFLAHQGQGPDVIEMLERLRKIMLDNAGTTELALTGQVQGSIHTGAALDKMLLSLIFLIEMKRLWWDQGLQRLFSQLLTLASMPEAVKEYGTAVINTTKSSEAAQFVNLTKDAIGDYRDVSIHWDHAVERDDAAAAQLEMAKKQQGLQSLYTTMENLGIDFPEDEIERIAAENSDPRLNPQGNAQLMSAASPMLQQQDQHAHEAAMAGAEPNSNIQLPPDYAGGNPEDRGGVDAIAQGLRAASMKSKRKPPVHKPASGPSVQYDSTGNPVIGG